MAGPIRIAILGNASSAVGAIRATDTATARLGTRFKSVALAAAKFAAAGVALGAGLAAYAAVNFAQAAANDAQQAAILAQTLSQAAGASRKQIAANEEWIASMGRSLGIADDDLRPALGKLAIATGSVAKAQRLASLAADVAAGRHKDLSTVVEALSKAQAGNLSGLTRLGVNIKDAAGNTKTLDQVTADLSKTYKGAATVAADSAAGKFQRMKLALSETAEAIGYKLLPLVTDVGDFLLDRGIPAVEKLADSAAKKLSPAIQDLTVWFRDNKDGLADLGGTILGTAIPALQQTAEVAGKLLGFFAGLPSPVKKFGAEVVLAALVLPRLNGALSTSSGAISTFATNVRNAETRTAALKNAARGAAGVAGIAALADGATRSSGALKTLENVAGGAALGFAIGGPWGAAIGGAGGLLLTLSQSTDKSSDSFKFASPQAGEYADQLNRVSGAATAATRNTAALALQQSGAIAAGQALGLSSRDLVKYVLGNATAVRKVERAIAASTSETITWTDQLGQTHTILAGTSADAIKLSTALGRNATAFDKSRAEAQQLSIANGTLAKALKNVKDRSQIITSVETKGFPESKRQAADLLAQYNLTPKELKTTLKALGVDASVSAVQRVIDRLAQVHDKTVTVTTVTRTVNGNVPAGNRPVNTPGETGRKQADDFLAGLVAGFQGFDGITASIERVTSYIEKQFADKFAKIKKHLNATLDGKPLEKALASLEKKLDKQQAKALKGLRDEEKALRDIGRAQDSNNAALEEHRAALLAITNQATEYANSIRDSVVEFGNLTALGGSQGFSSADQLVQLLAAKVDQAEQFAKIIDALRLSGLSETAIQQLINAGVEGGIGTAQAILAGGPAAIEQINTLQTRLTAAGTQLGTNASTALYGAGIQAAQGLVDGLAANADVLAAQATKLAKALVKAVKKALGVNSPSRVFREIGQQTVRGLTLGLDEDSVRRQGATLGRSLERGFGSPTLDAFLQARADSQRQTVEVTLTAQQLDAISRGRAVQADLDLYYANGGRRSA